MAKKEIGEIAVGNTKSTAIKPKKQPLQLKKWFFTWNNYPEDYEEILFNFIKKWKIKKYVWQREIGEKCGTKHIQGGIWLDNKARYSEFNLPIQIHWEAMKNEEAVSNYCSKAETSDGGLVKVGFPKPLKVITELKKWQKDIEDINKTEPDGRTIRWYFDKEGGKGKSTFCKYMAYHYKTLVIQGGKLGDIMNIVFNTNMDEVNMVIIDVPRCNGNKVSYASIECILNGMITNTKFETGVKMFNPPHVIVFSNERPEEDKLSGDRWKIITLKDT